MNDHVNIKISAFVDTPTYNTARRGVAAVGSGLNLLARGRGPASSPANHCQAFVKTERALPGADIQVQLMAFGFGTDADMSRNGITAVVSPCHPLARGAISLQTADPSAAPRITMSMLDNRSDIEALHRGCELTVSMLQAGPGNKFGARIYAPATPPASTCRMGPKPDDGAVVDATLAVHGLAGLSIADASIMPTVTAANTNIPVIAIAERAAGFIAARNG